VRASDGVDSLAASQAAGELPEVDVLADQEGGGDEGTAMLEIMHDVAPGSALGFATADISDASFADNIRAALQRALRRDRRRLPVLQRVAVRGRADRAVGQRRHGRRGAVLLVGRQRGQHDRRHVRQLRGRLPRSGQGVGKFAGEAHDFDPGPATQLFEPISDDSSANVPIVLWWADKLGAANDDYDLYLFDDSGEIINFSQNVQDGDDDPWEWSRTPSLGWTDLRVAVVRYRGGPRYFQLSALRSRFEGVPGLPAWVTGGMTRGHSAAADAFTVAAAPAAGRLPFDLEPDDPPNPSGPFPGVFTAAQAPERFTSDGPRRMFFPAPVVRSKPDITAADGVMTSVPDFDPFFGTSAAAPDAAAIAGLMLSGNPGMTSDEVREALHATALDLAPAGVDARTGHGLLRADSALAYTGGTPQPLVQAGAPDVAPADRRRRRLPRAPRWHRRAR
jgi:hypothetical protein